MTTLATSSPSPDTTQAVTNATFSRVLRRLDAAGLGADYNKLGLICRRIVAAYFSNQFPAVGLRSLVRDGEIDLAAAAESLADRIIEAGEAEGLFRL